MVTVGEAAYRQLSRRAARVAAGDLAARGPWLILAPHPDDETLGCGGLIAGLCDAGAPPLVVFVTDGAGSHRNSPTWPRQRLAAERVREAAAALRVLGLPRRRVLHLCWPDADPPAEGSSALLSARHRLGSLCRRRGVRALAVTWSGEPHCDHVAAHRLAAAVAADAHGRISLHEYLVWGWTLPDLPRRLKGAGLLALDAAGARGRRRRALSRHRTQTTALIADAEHAFLLPPEVARLTERRTELLIDTGCRRAA